MHARAHTGLEILQDQITGSQRGKEPQWKIEAVEGVAGAGQAQRWQRGSFPSCGGHPHLALGHLIPGHRLSSPFSLEPLPLFPQASPTTEAQDLKEARGIMLQIFGAWDVSMREHSLDPRALTSQNPLASESNVKPQGTRTGRCVSSTSHRRWQVLCARQSSHCPRLSTLNLSQPRRICPGQAVQVISSCIQR